MSTADQAEIVASSSARSAKAPGLTPYAVAGARLVDNGYSAIPLMPGTKRPGNYTMKNWHGANDWQRFCDRVPTTIETDAWSKWPDAGVCVAIGHQLKVIDIDTDDPELLVAVQAVLPDSEVKKRGKKGFSAFYRGSPTIRSQSFSVGMQRIVDLLCHGRQTVSPPTIHPDTGQPYAWVSNETLLNVDVHALPLLPDNITELLAAALTPFGYQPEEKPHRVVAGGGDSYWREVNDTALKNLPAWVPDLRLKGTKKSGRGYRVTAEWRGVEGANVSIHPGGIKDWGNDESHTPIDIVMKAIGVDLNSATNFLAERLNLRHHLADDGFDVRAFIKRNTNTAANNGGNRGLF
jgi:hypothetical protein